LVIGWEIEARAKARQAGERLEPETAITFAHPLDMLECLLRQRIRIVQTIRQQKLSISPLAEELAGVYSEVWRDS
jgi:predicted transcriptional regulator